MKNLKKFSAVVGATALLAVAFTGCNNSFAGTELNFAEKETNTVGKFDSQDNKYWNGLGQAPGITSSNFITVTADSTIGNQVYINKASSRTTITVQINNANGTNKRLNTDSIKEAVEFWNFGESSKAGYYTPRAAKLPVTKVFSKTETASSATLEFEVDVSSVTKPAFGLTVNAAKLKDKQGTLILNLDGNDKAGEESDNYIKSIGITNGATASFTNGLTLETFNPDEPTWASAANVVERLNSAAPYDRTATFFVVVPAPSWSHETFETTPALEKGLASKFNESLKLRIRKPGSSSTEEKALTFEYKESYSNGAATSANAYISQDIALEPGTRYEIISTEIDMSAFVPAWYKDYYGHTANTRNKGFGYKSVIGNARTADTYVTQASANGYIINDYDSSVTTGVTEWHAQSCDYEDAQKKYFSNLNSDNFADRAYKLYLNKNAAEAYRLAYAANPTKANFKVVYEDTANDLEYELPIEVSVKMDDADITNPKVDYVYIEITNKNFNPMNLAANTHLYVGNGLALAANPQFPTQLKFGAPYKDVADGIHAGWTKLF